MYNSDKFSICFVILLLNIILVTSPIAYANQDMTTQDLYFKLEARVFDRDLLKYAISRFQLESSNEPKDPWLYLSASLAVQIAGYKIGDWYSEDTFLPEPLDEALRLAEYTQDFAPNLSQAHSHFARLLIVKKEYKKAWDVLNKAYLSDQSNFYPWYYRGIIAEKMKDTVRGEKYFHEAEKLATYDHQHNLLRIHRQKLAAISKDYAKQERLLKENIEKNPGANVYYGNYAHFLMEHERYDEAIEYLEKAIAIAPYKEAVEKLERAKKLRDAK